MAKKRDLPVVSVLERRLLNPFGTPSVPIVMKDGAPWATHWFASEVRSGRIHQALQLGWVYVTPADVEGTADELGFEIKDGRITRGPSGSEVLMKMPGDDYAKIQKAKFEKNRGEMGGKKLKSEVAQRAAKEFGDEAADTIYGSDLEVKDSRVSIDLDGDGPPR